MVGTSGWSYPEWVNVFYPSNKESKLSYYSRIFSTAEIDSTFYAFPAPGTVMGWQKYSPKGFSFHAKLPQSITHEKLYDLDEPLEKELDRFADLMRPLNNAEKLGCLLIQLPPRYKYDLQHLESFLSLLPHDFKYAIEFRNKSWLQGETWKLLSRYNVAYTIVDEPLLPPEIHITSDFAYLRWHGRGQRPWYDYEYTTDELKEWLPRVHEVESSTKTVYGFFNNHFHGYAIENALEILDMLGKLTPPQEQALLVARKRLKEPKEQATNLSDWTSGGEKRVQLVELLASIMGETRLARSFTISETEVNMRVISRNHIEGNVRNYHVSMDRIKHRILHDCGDWQRAIETHRLCKHIGKVFLSIPEEIGLDWVMTIEAELEDWHFANYEQPLTQ